MATCKQHKRTDSRLVYIYVPEIEKSSEAKHGMEVSAGVTYSMIEGGKNYCIKVGKNSLVSYLQQRFGQIKLMNHCISENYFYVTV